MFYFHKKRPLSGTVVLLFQPAEETGEGAALVISDPKFEKIKPDYVFALHNLPGYSLGKVFIRSGIFASASKGMIIKLFGKTSHAAHPEDGISPTISMCSIIEGLHVLPAKPELENIFSFVTVVYARLGEIAFGTAPGYAEIMATLRTATNQNMTVIAEYAIQFVEKYRKAAGLSCEISWQDEFAATSNDTKAYEIVKRAAFSGGIEVIDLEEPFRWSEDFGEFTNRFKGAMIGIGAGEDCPQLHSPDYDFPDMTISEGIRLLWEILYDLLK